MGARNEHDAEILRLAAPAFVQLAAEPLYVLVDTAVVGHLGTPELGGLAVAGTVLTTGLWLFNFLAYGTTAAVSRAIGAGEPARAAGHAVQGLWLAVALGALLAIGGALGAPALVSLMGAGDAVRPHAETYLRVSALGAPAVLVTLVGMGFCRGMQDTRTPLLVAIASNVANLVLELVLIFGLGMGVGGSALATVVAQYGGAAAFLAILWRALSGARVGARPRATEIRAAASLNLGLMIRTGALLAALTLATAVAARIGAVALGAHQIAFQIWGFLAFVLDAVAIAAQAMIGRFLGAGDPARARSAGRRMIQWGVAGGLVLGGAIALAAGVLPAAFTEDEAVRAVARDLLLIVGAMQPLNAVVFVLDGVLIGAGDARFLAGAMVAGLAVFIPLALAVLWTGAGALALWGAIVGLMLARLAGMGSRFAGDRWAVTGSGRARS